MRFAEPRQTGGLRIRRDGPTTAALGARAYTHGRDIVLAPDVRPGTREWNGLVAHEMTHAAQGDGKAAPALKEEKDETPATEKPPAEKQAEKAEAAAKALPERDGPKGITFGDQFFDAFLDRKAGLLTIERPVELEFEDPSPEELAAELPIFRKWKGDAEKAEFKQKLFDDIFHAWSFKHVLVPDGDPKGETCPVVKVAVTATDKGSAQTPAIKMKVRALREGATTPGEGVLGQQGHLTSRAVQDVKTEPGRTQKPGVHEFGHALGLMHPVCPGNEPRCYGVTSAQRDSIMGVGMTVRPENYAPFVKAIEALSPAKWKVQEGWWTRFGAAMLLASFAGMGATIGAIAGGPLGALIGAGIGHVVGGIAALIHQFS